MLNGPTVCISARLMMSCVPTTSLPVELECDAEWVSLQVETETPDMWMGLLREPRTAGSPLGPTHKAILVEQFGRSIFGPQGFWWQTSYTMKKYTKFFTEEIESATLEKVISDNTGVTVSGNAFSMGGSVSANGLNTFSSAAVAGDVDSTAGDTDAAPVAAEDADDAEAGDDEDTEEPVVVAEKAVVSEPVEPASEPASEPEQSPPPPSGGATLAAQFCDASRTHYYSCCMAHALLLQRFNAQI